MSERLLVVNQLQISYEGLYDAESLYALINSYFYEKGYDWYERMNQEIVTPQGKDMRIILEPFKNVSDYYKIVIRIRLHQLHVQDIMVDVDHEQKQASRGIVKITVDGFLVNDRKDVWHTKPLYWALSLLFEKYAFNRQIKEFSELVEQDVELLLHKIRGFLNLFERITAL